MQSSMSSLLRIWKIRHSSPGFGFVRILRVVYFPVTHLCALWSFINRGALSAQAAAPRGAWDEHNFSVQNRCHKIPYVTNIPKQRPCNRPFYSCRCSDLASEWQRGWKWPCFDTDLTAFTVVMLTSCHLHEKSREVCIKARSPPASLAFMVR